MIYDEDHNKYLDETYGKLDSGRNRPIDYISLEEYELAEKSLETKSKWNELNANEIVVLRHKLHTHGLLKDVVFADRLDLINCVLFWTERNCNKNESVK